MKFHKSYLRILLLFLLVFLPKVAWGGSHYYAQVKATAMPNGHGLVYVSMSDSEPTPGDYRGVSETEKYDSGEVGNQPTVAYYLYYKESDPEYEFNNWYSDEACTKAITLTAGIYSVTAQTSSNFSETLVYAKFIEKTYKIIYLDDDGNSLAPPSGETWPSTFTKASGFTLPTPTKDHYTFLHWVVFGTDNQGGWTDGTTYDKDHLTIAPDTKNADVTFKAVWTPDTYTITYEENGGSWSTQGLTSYTYQTPSISLPQNMTKDESDFTGWTISGSNHNWGASIAPNVTSITGPGKYGNVTLIAEWKTKKYTITYLDDDGSSLAPPSGETWPSTFTKASGFTLPTPTKDHYTFLHWVVFGTDNQGGWTDGTTYDKDHLTIAPDTKNADVTFKAVWTPTPYTITYDPVGGTLDPNSTTQEYTYETNTISLYEVTKEESTFTGWAVKSTDDSQNNWPTSGYIQTSSIEGPKFGNVTLTATWDVTTYDVNFYDNDGKTQLNLLPNSYSKVDGFEFPSYSKPGYSVDYWEVMKNPGGGWDNSEASTEYVPGKIVTGKNADVDFKAHYKLDTYTITYNPNGGEVTQTTGTYDFENDFTLSVPEKAGCVFKGWKPEVESGSWVASQLYSGTVEAGTAYGDVTLIAQWLGGLIVKLEGSEDVSEDCYAVFKVSGSGAEYLISVSKNHPEVLGSLENGKTYTIESMDWHKAYILDSVKQEIKKVDDEQTVTFTATKTTPKVSDSHRDF